MPGSNKNRNTKNYKQSLKKNVDEKFNTLDIVSFSGYLELNEIGNPDSMKIFGPDGTPLHDFLQDDDLKKKLFDVSVETLMRHYEKEALGIQAQKRKDIIDKKEKKIRKPRVPVSSLTNSDLIVYFGQFIGDVYKVYDLKIKNKWALPPREGRENGIPPTPPCPFWNSQIIDEKAFFGTGKEYIFGNITHRMRLQIIHILMEMNEDPDTFADNIPANYVPKNFTKEDMSRFSKKLCKKDQHGEDNSYEAMDDEDSDDMDDVEEDEEDAIILADDDIIAMNKLIDEGENSENENLDYMYENISSKNKSKDKSGDDKIADETESSKDPNSKKDNVVSNENETNQRDIFTPSITEMIETRSDSISMREHFSVPTENEAGPSWCEAPLASSSGHHIENGTPVRNPITGNRVTASSVRQTPSRTEAASSLLTPERSAAIGTKATKSSLTPVSVRRSLLTKGTKTLHLTPERFQPNKENIPSLTPGSLKVKKISKTKKNDSKDALTSGFIRGVYEGKSYENFGRIQFLNFSDVENGTFFKYNDSEYCGYNILGVDTKIVERMKQLDKFTVIEVINCHRKGYGIIIEDFKVISNPGHLIMSNNVSQICFLSTKFLENLAIQAGASDKEGNKDSDHPFFKNRSPIMLRNTRSRSENKSEVPAKRLRTN